RYVRAHLGHLPVVVAARVGRVWGVYRPMQTEELDERGAGEQWPKTIGVVCFGALLGLGIVGLVLVRRRNLSVLPFASLAGVVTITAACFYGHPRFRVPVD